MVDDIVKYFANRVVQTARNIFWQCKVFAKVTQQTGKSWVVALLSSICSRASHQHSYIARQVNVQGPCSCKPAVKFDWNEIMKMKWSHLMCSNVSKIPGLSIIHNHDTWRISTQSTKVSTSSKIVESLHHVAPLCLSTSLGLFENQLQPLESLDSARSSYQAQSQAAVAQVLLFEEDCGKQWCLRIWSQNILPFCCYSIPFLPMSLHSLHCLTWSLHKEPLWRMHRVPSGPRFPMYLAVPQARCIYKQCDLRRSDVCVDLSNIWDSDGFWN